MRSRRPGDGRARRGKTFLPEPRRPSQTQRPRLQHHAQPGQQCAPRQREVARRRLNPEVEAATRPCEASRACRTRPRRGHRHPTLTLHAAATTASGPAPGSHGLPWPPQALPRAFEIPMLQRGSRRERRASRSGGTRDRIPRLGGGGRRHPCDRAGTSRTLIDDRIHACTPAICRAMTRRRAHDPRASRRRHSMADAPLHLLSIDGGVALLTLNRPQAHNALNRAAP